MRPATTVRSAVEGGEARCSAVEGNTARSACLPTSREPISLSSPRARAPSIVSMRSASSPWSPAAVASGQKVTSPVLTTESVPRPTRNPARRNAANGAAPLAAFRRAGLRVGLGTDSVVSTGDVTFWPEATAAGLQGEEALRMLTIEGARALGLEREIGSLDVGKQADLAVFPSTALHRASPPSTALLTVVAGRIVHQR